MSPLEDVIFGMAPLGILTAMVGAIRVGGPKWMRAAVGRAQEGKGIVEVELMSSTSTDVCEMWDGERVIRILGSPSVAQLFYLVPDEAHTAAGSQSRGRADEWIPLLPPLTGDEIYDLKSAAEAKALRLSHGTNHENTVLNSESNQGPNLALNLGGHIVSSWELYVVAIIGTVLQVGVILFAGLTGIYEGGMFKKDGEHTEVCIALHGYWYDCAGYWNDSLLTPRPTEHRRADLGI